MAARTKNLTAANKQDFVGARNANDEVLLSRRAFTA